MMASSASSAEHAANANQILTDARSLRKNLAAESAEANKKLSDALLDVVLYTEKLESLGRLLALADSCIGQIRSRMRASSIPIHPPSLSPNAAMPSDSVSRPALSGTFFSQCSSSFHLLHDNRCTRQFRVMILHICGRNRVYLMFLSMYIILSCFCAKSRFPASVLAPWSDRTPPATRLLPRQRDSWNILHCCLKMVHSFLHSRTRPYPLHLRLPYKASLPHLPRPKAVHSLVLNVGQEVN